MKATFGAILALALAVPACATHQIHYSNPAVTASGAPHAERQSFYLWGLIGGEPVDLAKVCPGGVAAIDSKSAFSDQLFSILTGGLYSPMSVEVQCGGGAVSAAGGAQ